MFGVTDVATTSRRITEWRQVSGAKIDNGSIGRLSFGASEGQARSSCSVGGRETRVIMVRKIAERKTRNLRIRTRFDPGQYGCRERSAEAENYLPFLCRKS